MKYTDEQRLEKIRSTTEKLLAFLQDESITADQVMAEETVRWTITTPLYNIGEQVYNLSDEFKQSHSQIPWAKISGLRHRLVHDYDNTNWSLICTILFDELPEFLTALQDL
ncbi:HepT-like ribonuclease domain-containing protein [Acutalibacter caecimuris]|uniref:HepT-like ribonuclease domain-containing protein n=1 Tax=Acutalibacter caecimuris TaxID=3093657 RepID=UPI002AC9A52D|nr:HepT-like ribonuclease domain-containing protein [Acutalibacter sp. M00118]